MSACPYFGVVLFLILLKVVMIASSPEQCFIFCFFIEKHLSQQVPATAGVERNIAGGSGRESGQNVEGMYVDVLTFVTESGIKLC
jgi:hypothetical protein